MGFNTTVVSITVATLILIGMVMVIDSRDTTTQMTACVTSGGEWRRTDDFPIKMECRRG